MDLDWMEGCDQPSSAENSISDLLAYLRRGMEDATSHVQVSRALGTIVSWQLS